MRARACGARRFLALVALAGATTFGPLVALPAPADAQIRMRNSEAQLLRDAANRESQGDFSGAAEVLKRLLQQDPGSSGGLFALERVLRAQGEIGELLPVVDRYLENDPGSSGVRYLKLRVLMEVDSLDALRTEAERWLDADPESEVPYREVARVYERAYGGEEALELLRRGRGEVGRDEALALEIGDLLASMGDADGAVDEWAVAVASDAAQTVTVTRRVQGLTSGVPESGRRLVGALGDSDDLAARRAGARIALDLGLGPEAMRLSQGVASDLDGRARASFLSDVARRARDQNLVEVASWAYDELGDDASSPAERRQFDQRIVDVALATGDSLTALEAQRRVADSFTPGSVDRRRATAQVIRLEGARAEPEYLRTLLTDFRRDYPNAPELDELAATVAGALNARGDHETAAEILDGVEGPRSTLERAYLLLDEGELEQARSALMLAVTGLTPSEATPVIQFAGLLGRVSPEGAERLALAGVDAHRGNVTEAAQRLADDTSTLPEDDRAPLLAEAARMATRGGADDVAAGLLATIVQDYADRPEVGEASLSLARLRARSPNGVAEAIRLLEELITMQPNAAIVPDARLELEKLPGARIVRALLVAALMLTASPVSAQWLLVPMDRQQANHLRAYGLTYWTLDQGEKAEWILNYRGGSFLLPDRADIRREAAFRGVTTQSLDASAEARLRATVDAANMEAIPLERAPKVAIYTPPNSTPWDDAVTMALEYAGIPYETIWDGEVLQGDLSDYEWIHLHHEDFTGQYSKFYLTYSGAPWLQEEVARNQEVARANGLPHVPALKKSVAETIRTYVEEGGFLFAMCSATETLELALAAAGVDIAAAYSDGTPPDPDASSKMHWDRTMAFTDAQVQIAPSINAFSDIDAHQVNTTWRKELGVYTLFDFSAKFDPVPSMLTQNHESVLPDFYGLTTSFREDRLKSGAIVLGQGNGWAKYVHGNLGEGTWTFFGGHDPEDAEHQIGDPQTDLALHPNSPGYRLILNNVLFPAAKKQKLKT